MTGLIVDLFAGGGGASHGIERGLGRPVDIAVNHDPLAVEIHRINHPNTTHYCEDIFAVDPEKATQRRPVQLLWASPDCQHHSKAKGGKPLSGKKRALAGVVIKWAKRVRPQVIMLENVEEFKQWGPLKRDGKPCPERIGKTFAGFCRQLTRLGYHVDHKTLRGCDYGAPTSRQRLFLIARRDGHPIVWPEPTHGILTPYRTAAECIDWSIPCPSIFDRKKPLADATCRRVARGIMQYVVNHPRPFIVPDGAACMIQTGYGERKGQAPRTLDIEKPLGTVMAGECKHALVMAFMTRYFGTSTGYACDEPARTVCAQGIKDGIVCAHIAKHYTGVTGHGMEQPLGTITCADHHSLVTSFLIKYYGRGTGNSIGKPLDTITTRDRFGLVTVKINGEDYYIADIGLRMLQPAELALAQGFPPYYVIDETRTGKVTKRDQTKLIGNSVCPDVAEALVSANIHIPEHVRCAA